MTEPKPKCKDVMQHICESLELFAKEVMPHFAADARQAGMSAAVNA